MTLHVRSPDHKIPEYSLTGDLLSYLKCPLQYRMYNRGKLPPSVPVQQWFGEFIHGCMEEAYARWLDEDWGDFPRTFPWNWDEHLRSIELAIFNRLLARGLPPPPGLLYQLERREYENATEDDRGIASKRLEVAVNSWGSHLFPLIEKAEVRLLGSVAMPPATQFRATRFSVTGIVDVLSSVRLREAPGNNIIIRRLRENPRIREAMDQSAEPFDIIIDYKGMRRPPISDPSWEHQAWQIQMYAWLRRRQEPNRRVLAGVLLYLNELLPSRTDMELLAHDVGEEDTDVMPNAVDIQQITQYMSPTQRPDDIILEEEKLPAERALTMPFREDRSFRLVEVDDASLQRSVTEFTGVVSEIETAVQTEIQSSDARNGWTPRRDDRTCVACDFKYHCPERGDDPKIP